MEERPLSHHRRLRNPRPSDPRTRPPESVYEVALSRVLTKRGLSVTRQHALPITFEGTHLDEGFRADLIVHSLVFVELKSQERLAPVHKEQVLAYLRLSGLRLNFGAPMMKDGIERFVNNMT